MIIQNDWTDLKLKIKNKWNKLTDEEIEICKDNLESISSKIQLVYGYAKEKAEKEYEDFKSSIDSKPMEMAPNNSENSKKGLY